MIFYTLTIGVPVCFVAAIVWRMGIDWLIQKCPEQLEQEK